MSGYIAELFCAAGAKELPKGNCKRTGLVIKDFEEPVYQSGYKPNHKRYIRKFYYDGSEIANIWWDTRIPIEEAKPTFQFNLAYGDVYTVLETVRQVMLSMEDFIIKAKGEK